MMIRKGLIAAVMAALCLAGALIAIRAYGAYWPYDPWWDINDDGRIDIKDLARVSGAFGTSGKNISKAGLAYDSGWLDLTTETNESLTVLHNLNISTSDLIVDVRERRPGWNGTYGDPYVAYASSLVQSTDGGYMMVGTLEDAGATSMLMIKTDADGNQLWNKTYGSTGADSASSVIQTVDGGYAVAGYTNNSTGYCWLVKTNATGYEEWNRNYGATVEMGACSVVQTNDTGYALAGTSMGYINTDFWLAKVDAHGTLEWSETYEENLIDIATSMIETKDGGYAIAGLTVDLGYTEPNFWLLKADSSGLAEWSREYGGSGWEEAHSVVQTSDGGYALAGNTNSSGAGNDDCWLVKTNATGYEKWNKTFGGPGHDEANAIVQSSDGGYAIAGTKNSNGFWLIKTDSSGVEQYNQTYVQEGGEICYDLIQTGDGSFALAGNRGNSIWLVKTYCEYSLSWTGLTVNSIIIHRGNTSSHWNLVRVSIWIPVRVWKLWPPVRWP